MKEKHILRIKCISVVLFIILSLGLILIGFTEEYHGSPLFSGGIGGLVVSLWMMKTIWTAKASPKNRVQFIIHETDERNLQIQTKSAAIAFEISLFSTFFTTTLALLCHEDSFASWLMILLGIQVFAFLLCKIFLQRKL